MESNESDAQKFFDQFVTHPKFEAIKAKEGGHWWCARHWAPCPAFGANGIGMTVELASIVRDAGQIIGATRDSLNALLNEADQPLCCRLGDERMYQLWGNWGPE